MAGPDKYVDDASKDKLLADIADSGNQLYLVSQSPESYADVATYSLGAVVLPTGDGNGAYTIQDGAVSGRRLTLAQQTVEGTGNGVASHAVIIDTVNARIKAITTAPNYNMQTGVNQTVPSYDVTEVKDPA
jgi:hypothetical protein